MNVLDIALVQQAADVDPAGNRRRLRTCVETLCARTPAPDLVVFPEAWQRDFGEPSSDLAGFAEPLDGPFVTTLRELAGRFRITLVAGMFEVSEEPRRPYNTLAVVGAEGLVATYRKIHLYDSFGYRESRRLSPGQLKPVTVDIGGFPVGLLTCYDLRFPELARELVGRGAELLVVPSAWVAGPDKVEHWRTLVRARAIENTVYVAAAGQPGPRYSGHSMVVDPNGRTVGKEAGEEPALLTATLERRVLAQARERNPSLANRRF